jgi:hypothetical protein
VPEDSVRPETQTLVILIRRKGFVGSFKYLNYLLAKILKIKKKKKKKKTKEKEKTKRKKNNF